MSMFDALIARTESHLLAEVSGQRLVARDHHRRRPAPGLDAEHPELDRQQRGVALGLGDVRVHAAHVGFDDRLAARMVAVQLVIHVTAEHVEARASIAQQLAAAKDLGDGAGRLPSPHFELERAILRGGISLREEQVALVLRVDVIDAPAIAEDLHWLRQPRQLQRRGGCLRRTVMASVAASNQSKETTRFIPTSLPRNILLSG